MKTPELHIPHHSKIEEFLALAELGKQARVIFHDLANHFTSLNLTIQELENNLATERDRFREYSKRSNETRAQMEYVARLLRSHMQGKNEPFTADNIVTGVITVLEDKIKRCKTNVVLNLDKNISFQSGKREFIHIVTNLLCNSIESIDPNSEKPNEITVKLDQDATRVFLSVSDTGCGIKKKDRGKIFSSGYTTKKTGNGIGLVAVKEMVEEVFRGKIEFRSTKSNTNFKITIPKQNRKRISPPVLKSSPDFRLLSESFKGLSDRSAV